MFFIVTIVKIQNTHQTILAVNNQILEKKYYLHIVYNASTSR